MTKELTRPNRLHLGALMVELVKMPAYAWVYQTPEGKTTVSTIFTRSIDMIRDCVNAFGVELMDENLHTIIANDEILSVLKAEYYWAFPYAGVR